MNQVLRSLALIAGLATAAGAHAVTDPAEDILRSFTGDGSVGAFDILSSDVTRPTTAPR